MTNQSHQTQNPTFLEHILELRTRLFWIVGSIVVFSVLGYLVKDAIIYLIVTPLGDQQLFYLTPMGGLNFILKICFYFGLLASIPILIYHLCRYLQPLMPQRQPMRRYFVFSILLAAAGVCFAYFISLPAALHFLTDFQIDHISAMLTVDSYLTFVISYLLGAALLFQIPLILLIINRITPLTPGGLMRYQRHVILVAFIAAAIVSPTPDIMNQFLLSIPIIAMYQVGVFAIWIAARRRRKEPSPSLIKPARQKAAALPQKPMPAKPKTTPSLISDFGPRPAMRPSVTTPAKAPPRSQLLPNQSKFTSPQSVSLDGIMPRRRMFNN